MPGARQIMMPPYGVGQFYRLVSNVTDANDLVTYVGPNPVMPNRYLFRKEVKPNEIVMVNPTDPPTGVFVVQQNNAGGRRKSRRSKRSKRSTRKSRRRC